MLKLAIVLSVFLVVALDAGIAGGLFFAWLTFVVLFVE